MFIELYRKFLVSVLFVFLSSGFAQAARNSKSCGAEGVKGASGKPPCRLRRGETPASGKPQVKGFAHPFTAPPMMPPTICRRKMTNTASVGSRTIMLAAMTGP